jgi:hypothetical protein
MLTYADLSDDMLFGDMDAVSDAAGFAYCLFKRVCSYVLNRQ